METAVAQKQRIRDSIRRTLRGSVSLLACAVFLLSACCFTLGFLRAGDLTPMDYGQYEAVLRDCGLTWTDADLERGELQYSRSLEHFRYTRFSFSSLLTPQAGGALVYLTAVCRLFTQPFGLDFSVTLLAAAEALILALSAAMLTLALRRRLSRGWYWPGVLLCGLFADGNFCAMLRGMDPVGGAVTFTVLLAALFLQAFSLPRERRAAYLPPLTALSFITLKTSTPLIVFLPLVLAGLAALFISSGALKTKKYVLTAVCALLLTAGCVTMLQEAGESTEYFSHAAAYESVFNTMLPASKEPERILGELELPEDYAADIGRSYYEDEGVYVHNPRDAGEAEILFSRLTPGRILGVYLRDPGLLFRVIRGLPFRVEAGFESGRNRSISANTSGYMANRVGSSLLMALWHFFPQGYSFFFAAQLALIVGGAVMAIIRRHSGYLFISLAAFCCALFLPFCTAFCGGGQAQQYGLFQVLLTLALWMEGLVLASACYPVFAQWLTRYTRDPYLPEAPAQPCAQASALSARAWPHLRRMLLRAADSRRALTLLTVLATLFVLCTVFLPSDHPVSVNNGDFGRMMAQLDLTWPGYLFYDSAGQLGRGAVEEYEYLAPFQPLKLTPLQPTYSLYWFASLVRLLTEPFGMPFSTLLLAWIMGLISLLCTVRLVWDLYPLLKRWTLAAAMLLSVLLFSGTCLTWYNSLFGEGCILIGLLLTLTCAVHLLLMPREKSWKRTAWLAGLALSLYILITAKAQMLLATPGAIALFVALSVYQRPYRYDLQAVQGLVTLAVCVTLAFSAVGVYETDRSQNAVSQRHTMWQAYFYGIFMISDDPIADMEALGVDTAMAADIGKYVDFGDDSKYVYAPLSEEAEEAFYSHVSMGSIIRWYLTHPGKLWLMLNHAAQESQSLYTGFRVYRGQDYSSPEHETVIDGNLWPLWRSSLTPGSFAGYVLFYGLLLILCLRLALRRGAETRLRILCALPLFLMLTGVLQFPLSVLGNGFADNQKQLFCFSLCHDFLLAGSLLLFFRWLWGKENKMAARGETTDAGVDAESDPERSEQG